MGPGEEHSLFSTALVSPAHAQNEHRESRHEKLRFARGLRSTVDQASRNGKGPDAQEAPAQEIFRAALF